MPCQYCHVGECETETVDGALRCKAFVDGYHCEVENKAAVPAEWSKRYFRYCPPNTPKCKHFYTIPDDEDPPCLEDSTTTAETTTAEPTTTEDFSGICAVDNGGCHKDAACSSTDGSCTCKTGYAGSGTKCYEVVVETTTNTPAPTTTAGPSTCVGRATEEEDMPCTCGDDCHTCAFTDKPGACKKCKNSQYLFGTDCVAKEDCSGAGKTPSGAGKFGRVCKDKASGGGGGGTGAAECKGKKVAGSDIRCSCSTDCHTCGFEIDTNTAGACTMCKNKRYLSDGACVTEEQCQATGETPTGNGSFKRTCGSDKKCVKKQNDCHQCNKDGSACEMCRNKAYLHEGVCQSSCPEGTTK